MSSKGVDHSRGWECDVECGSAPASGRVQTRRRKECPALMIEGSHWRSACAGSNGAVVACMSHDMYMELRSRGDRTRAGGACWVLARCKK